MLQIGISTKGSPSGRALIFAKCLAENSSLTGSEAAQLTHDIFGGVHGHNSPAVVHIESMDDFLAIKEICDQYDIDVRMM